jgi:hypothetical protein
MAPIVVGMIVHFMFHILYISIRKLLCFSLFSDFCMTFLFSGFAASVIIIIIIIIIIIPLLMPSVVILVYSMVGLF